jgi:hypothetical protein
VDVDEAKPKENAKPKKLALIDAKKVRTIPCVLVRSICSSSFEYVFLPLLLDLQLKSLLGKIEALE